VQIPNLIREIVEAQDGTRFDRSHFKSCGPFSLDYETVFYVLDPDYNRYMDIQQAINLAIFERFESEGIEFAYPTQTVVLQGAPVRAL
jgi:small-conductance mechanosensitive channel